MNLVNLLYEPFYSYVDATALDLYKKVNSEFKLTNETDEELVLTKDVPGIKKEEIDLTIEKNTLLLKTSNPNRNYYSGWRLGFKPENVEASLEDGVLKIVIKKTPKPQPTKILIK